MIPARIANWIADLHLQRFLVRLRLHPRILAGKACRFDGLCCVWLESFQKLFLGECFHANCFANAATDIFDLFFGQLRKHRQRKKFVGEFLRYWECALYITEISAGLLKMNRHRIMHCATDSFFLEMSQYCVAFLYPN